MIYERSYVINLDRRGDRISRFYRGFPACMEPPERIRASDGWTEGPEGINKPAWGCLHSHLRIFKTCLDEGVSSVLIFEDDAIADEAFCARWDDFCAALPGDYQFVYLGGVPMHPLAMPKVKELIYMPRTVRATHAYLVRQPMLGEIYARITESGHSSHIDHWYEGYFGRDGRPGYYCPNKWLFHQSGGYSDISGQSYGSIMRWTDPEDTRNAKYVVRGQVCDQDENGKCRRKRCGRVMSTECAIGNGLMKVEL